MLHEGKLYSVLRLGPHYFIMSKCKAVKHVKTYFSPVDVEEFRAVILGAGTGLAPLLKFGQCRLVRCVGGCGGSQHEGEMGDVLG